MGRTARVLPFFLLVILLMGKIVRTRRWMLRTGNPYHPAVPLAMVLLAGIVHAGLENWLFAPGYYVCVFFWSMAFLFVDLVPSRAVAAPAPVVGWPQKPIQEELGSIVAS